MAKALQAQRYRQLPALLRRMREEAGLTQRDLAKRLRMSHTMVHSSETAERRVDVAEFLDWARACGVDPAVAFNEFLGGQKQAGR
jgi:transcriptional regulator with XRE-family HTH domain